MNRSVANAQFTYEIPVTDTGADNLFKGTILLRLWSNGRPLEDPDVISHFCIRTRQRIQRAGYIVQEPFWGFLPADAGAHDLPGPGERDPDRLAWTVLSYFADWRNPPPPLTRSQRRWFRAFVPALVASMPVSEAQPTWLGAHRLPAIDMNP
ncbi:hypothetical protein [Nonomuraea angiospora]|uniref:hypothetical protein n=1 Tax=Nonomuraea angiospora TaxID=46172 RepID=UPI0029AE7ADD|nr:hypothetical protein [Nonomuraea angiospora]MDX3108836.1 hypothetical protein [Nonomuraea angiospora]